MHAIVLANYEKFSSTVKDFQVLYSVQSPNLAEDDDEDDEEMELGGDVMNEADDAAAAATTTAPEDGAAAAAKGTNASGSTSGSSGGSIGGAVGAGAAGGQKKKKAAGAGGWQELGTFQARERAGEQRFEVSPPRYARYLKVRFLTHWSKEFYCTLSQIKVRGWT